MHILFIRCMTRNKVTQIIFSFLKKKSFAFFHVNAKEFFFIEFHFFTALKFTRREIWILFTFYAVGRRKSRLENLSKVNTLESFFHKVKQKASVKWSQRSMTLRDNGLIILKSTQPPSQKGRVINIYYRREFSMLIKTFAVLFAFHSLIASNLHDG